MGFLCVCFFMFLGVFFLKSYELWHLFSSSLCVCLFPFVYTPDDSLDAEDSDQRTHFPQFSYSASIREWSLRLMNKQAGWHTITIPHTHLHCWGIWTTQNKKWHKTHFHSVFNTHAHTWQIRQDTDNRIGNEHKPWMTDLSEFVWIDWQLCLCTSSQGWL